ncbi:MAG: hypothetical protein GEU74_05250 [Nitriliruptorales bacterium]|nr:hypothetical protein [Nitriliruptorales bacterium]
MPRASRDASPEGAVRNYLSALRDPDSLRDEKAVQALRAKLDKATDPVERLRLRSDLERAEAVDVAGFEREFVRNARSFSRETGISGQVLLAEGVPRSVLRKAGLLGSDRSGGSRARRTRVNAESIRAAYPRKGTKFTIAELAQASGASTGAVRKVVTEDVNAGVVVNAGVLESTGGPGRAPTAYKRV